MRLPFRAQLTAIAAIAAAAQSRVAAQPACPADPTPAQLESLSTVALPDNHAQQGIAADAQYYYLSRVTGPSQAPPPARLSIFTHDWALLFESGIAYDPRIRHVGDIDIAGERVYAPVSDFPPNPGGLQLADIAWFDKATLQYIGHVSLLGILTNIGPGDLAAVAVYDNSLYAVEYQPAGSGQPRLIALPLVNGSPDAAPAAVSIYPIDTQYANGIAFFGGNLYISAGTTNPSSPCPLCCASDPCDGIIDVYDVEALSTSALNLPFSTSDYACPYIHAEGIAFDAESLWTAQNDHVIQLQSPILDDAYEPNDSALAALDFGPLSLAPLHEVLSMTNDADWFAFITLEAGTTGDFVKIEFDAALGNLDLCLYAASSLATPIGCSQAAANSEMLSLAGLPAGAYLVNVLGQQGAINPCYTLTIDPPASTLRSGDLTGDAQSDGLDIQPFIAALIEGSSDAAHLAAADFDNSGAIDPPDIPLFVDALLNG